MDEHAPETRRPLTLIIDPDPVTQTLMATQARQLGREPLVAGDAISGLDLAARHVEQLGLAVVEIRLPDMDGYDVCLRLRDLGLQHAQLFPILPFTTTGVMEMLLDEIGCERPCFKPATPERIGAALRQALEAPRRHLARTPLLTFARQRAMQAEQMARYQRAPRIALLSASLPVRLGLRQLLTDAGGRVVLVSDTAELLDRGLSAYQPQLLVADGEARDAAARLAARRRLPLLLIATTAEQVVLLADDAPALTTPHGLIAALDERSPSIIAAALTALTQGLRFFHLPLEQLRQSREAPIPEVVTRLLWEAGLTRREREVLWLDVQGWSDPQIAERLQVTRRSVVTYWKRALRKLGRSRPEARAWLREQLAQAGPGAEAECPGLARSVGGSEHA
jgi:DNA-binding NarL/FixJ family response regulator